MQRSELGFILHGVLAGILAGAVVAAWFLVVDFVASEPFHTPARLASIILREEFHGPWPRLVVLYTILHFGVFASLGLATAWILNLLDVDPGLIVGAGFGIGVLNAVHYAGLLVTGTNLLAVVPTVQVFAANLLGGMLMMAYLHRALRAQSPLGWNVLKRYPLLFDGLITGLVGATAVAFWLFLVDLVASRPFYAPAALGSAVMLGAGSPTEVQLNLGVIVAYSFLHVAAFFLVGIAFAWLASRARRAPAFWLRAVLVLVLLEGLFLGTVAIASGWVLEDLGWFTTLVANVLAVVSMGAWTWRQHPKLRD